MILSKTVYKSFKKLTTCNGVLLAESSVNPTISLKYIVTWEVKALKRSQRKVLHWHSQRHKKPARYHVPSSTSRRQTAVAFGLGDPRSFSSPRTAAASAHSRCLPSCSCTSPSSPLSDPWCSSTSRLASFSGGCGWSGSRAGSQDSRANSLECSWWRSRGCYLNLEGTQARDETAASLPLKFLAPSQLFALVHVRCFQTDLFGRISHRGW